MGLERLASVVQDVDSIFDAVSYTHLDVYKRQDPDPTFLRELCEYHVSGQLKVAPEHVADPVLKRMGKPGNRVYRKFVQDYKTMNEKLGKKQYLVPYLMSSHPGSTTVSYTHLDVYKRQGLWHGDTKSRGGHF